MTRTRLWLARRCYRLADRTIASRFIPAWFKAWVVLFFTETAYLLEYEPSWFGEFGLALGAAGWGFCSLCTDDFQVDRVSMVLPVLSILLGAGRIYALLILWTEGRVYAAGLTAMLWAWLWWALAGAFGVIGMMGLLFGVFVIDVLTAAKFSLPCAREVRADFLVWRKAR